MRRGVLSLFGRGSDLASDTPAKPAPLPETVRDVIDTASVMFRADTGENAGLDRAIVQLPGFTGFVFSGETASKVIARAWPELNERQVAQALRRLGQVVSARRAQHVQSAAHRQAVLDGTAPDTRPYMTRY